MTCLSQESACHFDHQSLLDRKFVDAFSWAYSKSHIYMHLGRSTITVRSSLQSPSKRTVRVELTLPPLSRDRNAGRRGLLVETVLVCLLVRGWLLCWLSSVDPINRRPEIELTVLVACACVSLGSLDIFPAQCSTIDL
jgi:hypothetical protein